ncbi:hypothetical protein FD755_008981 [Muntiacus reevesi]|uniref:DNA annealing helicase and endonuclease ZRANB3 n=1 Tax=Muntiacus reevesi TaxID=9886 RepID=A0A5J5MNT6_MUNRE|nr:hypothetical protein FD755_008981 [Muntiacus reevesi]
MGLGKTVQAIGIAYFYKVEWPLLVVVPSSLRYPWTEEIEKWIPELSPEEINVIQNKTDVGRISTSKVTVLGYGLLTTDAETLIDALNNQNFKVVIVDESHYMKSRSATRSRILLPIVQKAKRAILLTGTPALGRPEELFMQIEALFPQKFGTWTEYAKRYCNAHELNSSFEEWEKLMRAPYSGATETVMGLITRMFKQTAIAKTRYIRIDGSVPSSERIHLVNQFQKDPETRVAILSIQAAGQGLTFTAATHVVFAELYWDPGHIKQAEDRAHRIGQCSSVNIHYLIANGTLDTLMWGMLNRKFEKEKQRDIRSFFLPNTKKRRLETSCDESRVSQQKNTVVPADPGKTATRDDESDLEPEAKKLKLVAVDGPCRPAEETPCRPGQADARRAPGACGAEARASTPGLRGGGWQCDLCTYINGPALPRCEMCESPRAAAGSLSHTQNKNKNEKDDSQDTSEKIHTSSDGEKQVLAHSTPEPLAESKEEISKAESEDRLIPQPGDEQLKSSDAWPVYDTLMFCASKNTDRIHVYTKDGNQMNCNFIPLDIKLDLWEDLPASFQLKQNRSLILRFVREWSSLTAMKQRIIRKSGLLFRSPVLALEEIAKQQTKPNSTKRYITKEDVAAASMDKVKNDGGHVRLITKGPRPGNPSTKEFLEDGESVPFLNACTAHSDLTLKASTSKGYLQAVDNEGNPLCLLCQQPTCQTKQERKADAWDSRFCSLKCQEEFWIRSNNSYLRAKVFEIEHGVCQLCNLNAQELFLRLRDAPKSQRKGLLDATWTSKLPLEQLNEMIRSPGEGHFWQVDHIRPVSGGGGQCSLDNLQTLCTVCHRERTARQAKERSQVRRQSLASKHGSDITRFLVKK